MLFFYLIIIFLNNELPLRLQYLLSKDDLMIGYPVFLGNGVSY